MPRPLPLPVEIWRHVARFARAPVPDLKAAEYAPPEGHLSQNDLVALMRVSPIVNAGVAPILYEHPIVYDLSKFFYDREDPAIQLSSVSAGARSPPQQSDDASLSSRWTTETKAELLGHVKTLFLENDHVKLINHVRHVPGDPPIVLGQYVGGGRYEEIYAYDALRTLKLGVARGLGIMARARSSGGGGIVFGSLKYLCIGAYASLPIEHTHRRDGASDEHPDPLYRATAALNRVVALEDKARGSDIKHGLVALLCGTQVKTIYVRRAEYLLSLPNGINNIPMAMETLIGGNVVDDTSQSSLCPTPIWVFHADWTHDRGSDQFPMRVWGGKTQVRITVGREAWNMPSRLHSLSTHIGDLAAWSICCDFKRRAEKARDQYISMLLANKWTVPATCRAETFGLDITVVMLPHPLHTKSIVEDMVDDIQHPQRRDSRGREIMAAADRHDQATLRAIQKTRREMYDRTRRDAWWRFEVEMDVVMADYDEKGIYLPFLKFACASVLQADIEDGPWYECISIGRRILSEHAFADSLHEIETDQVATRRGG